MKELNIDKWNRKSHYELFNSYVQPCFRIDVRLDVTKLVQHKKELGGLFAPFTYIVMRALNESQGPRLRIIDDKIFDCEVIHPSYTLSLPDGNFAFCRVEYTDDYQEFLKRMKEESKKAQKQINQGDNTYFSTNNAVDVAYISCMPWIDFTSISNPLPYGDKISMSIPRLNWGKFTKMDDDKYEVTLSATFNHALIDGREAAGVLNSVEEMLLNAEKYLKF